ncbi:MULTISPECIES: hypothetical protein [Aquimarina]|uniref:hypothetical protein n=1 Tax=Aquimarina TaxID=290174 RepID=UPI0009422CDC|nr:MULTISPECIES: hypothetical protein [Aquimarina]
MKKSLLNLGRFLHRDEQKHIKGGHMDMSSDNCKDECETSADCPSGQACHTFDQSKSCPSHPKVKICM